MNGESERIQELEEEIIDLGTKVEKKKDYRSDKRRIIVNILFVIAIIAIFLIVLTTPPHDCG